MGERNLVAVSIKHTIYGWKFGMPCWLWGSRTKDEEKRSFGGYTQYPNNAEVYSLKSGRKAVMVLAMYARWMNRCRCVSVFARNTKNMTPYLFHSISTSNTASALACRWINQRRADNEAN